MNKTEIKKALKAVMGEEYAVDILERDVGFCSEIGYLFISKDKENSSIVLYGRAEWYDDIRFFYWREEDLKDKDYFNRAVETIQYFIKAFQYPSEYGSPSQS